MFLSETEQKIEGSFESWTLIKRCQNAVCYYWTPLMKAYPCISDIGNAFAVIAENILVQNREYKSSRLQLAIVHCR